MGQRAFKMLFPTIIPQKEISFGKKKSNRSSEGQRMKKRLSENVKGGQITLVTY